MKSSTKFRNMNLVALFGIALAVPVMAQPGSGMVGGRGSGGMGGAGMRFDQNNTVGWSLMTQEERWAHRSKMMSAKTYNVCKKFQAEQHATMESRAKEKGMTLQMPLQNGCDRMKARGIFK